MKMTRTVTLPCPLQCRSTPSRTRPPMPAPTATFPFSVARLNTRPWRCRMRISLITLWRPSSTICIWLPIRIRSKASSISTIRRCRTSRSSIILAGMVRTRRTILRSTTAFRRRVCSYTLTIRLVERVIMEPTPLWARKEVSRLCLCTMLR